LSHRATRLAVGHINEHRITIELVRPEGRPSFVRVVWPPQAATVISTGEFPNVASNIANLFARAHVTLASLKAAREL
jgi:hypothetical protein